MMASSSTSGKLGHWLKLCKDVLSASTGGWGRAPLGGAYTHLSHMIESRQRVAVSPRTCADSGRG